MIKICRFNEAGKNEHNVKKLSVANLKMWVCPEMVLTRLLMSEDPTGLSTMI